MLQPNSSVSGAKYRGLLQSWAQAVDWCLHASFSYVACDSYDFDTREISVLCSINLVDGLKGL